MPKSKNKRRRKTKSRIEKKQPPTDVASQPKSAASQPKGVATWKIGLSVTALLVAGGVGWLWYANGQSEQSFLENVQRGQSALDTVEKPADAGRSHGLAGASLRYTSALPTSGTHAPNWVRAGVYDSVQRREELVHSLEHGLVVIYYDSPGAQTLKTLTAWAKLFAGPWSGVVLTPKPGLGEAIALTAWNRRLKLDRFDADAAAAFVDAFRGRGPENVVR